MIDNELFRLWIGLLSGRVPQRCTKKSHYNGNSGSGGQVMYAGNVFTMYQVVCFILFLITYIYTLCLSLAFTVDISISDLTYALNGLPINILHNLKFASPGLINVHMIKLLNLITLYIIATLLKSLLPGLLNKVNMKSVSKYNKRYSIFSKISHLFSFWLASINLVLIVLVNPSIINPGPNNQHNISVLYQNVRGLIPFNYLGKPSPMLDNTKMCEPQSYVYYNKIDIVVLNETWLVGDIKNEEIFPSNAYKIF